MKNNRFSWALISIGIFLITASIILSNSLILKFEEVNSINSTNKIVVTLTASEYLNEKFTFTHEDIANLKNILENTEITYTTNFPTTLCKNNKNIDVNIIGTNSQYINFYKLNFINGFFFTKLNESENDHVAVIDKNLAWEIFGSFEVTGDIVEIFGDKFEIIGVASSSESIINMSSYSKKPNIYIPIKLLNKLDNKASINSLQIKMPSSTIPEDNIKTVKKALTTIGKSPENYHISDYNIEKKFMTQKLSLIIFVSGVICIFIIIRALVKKIRNIYILIKSQCHINYLTNVLKNNSRFIIVEFLKIIPGILYIFLLWNIIKFDFYIPPDHIPKELIDIDFFWDLFKKNISKDIVNKDYTPILCEINLKSTIMFLNWLFYTAIFLGFPMVYTGFYQLKLQRVHPYKTILRVSTIFILSIFLCIILICLSHISIWLDTCNLIIIFSLFYLMAYNSKIPTSSSGN